MTLSLPDAQALITDARASERSVLNINSDADAIAIPKSPICLQLTRPTVIYDFHYDVYLWLPDGIPLPVFRLSTFR